jgi:hypothetical protein
MRALAVVAFLLPVVILGNACSSSKSDAAAACADLKVYTAADDAPECEPALDDACCSQQSACANNGECAKMVACINACPKPRTDECIDKCTGGDPSTEPVGYVGGIQSCSYMNGPPGCGWPKGGN